MPRRRDQLDLLLEEWARTRRELLGIKAPDKASGMVGATRCTLGARRDLHAGSRSFGRVEQHWPEVYPAHLIPVNNAVRSSPEALQDIAHVHYVIGSRAVKQKAKRLNLDLEAYWERVNALKRRVESAIERCENWCVD